MSQQGIEERDVVTPIIKYCHLDHGAAEKLFDDVALHKMRTVTLPDENILLSDEEAGEFIERYSAEVEPTIWESKRRKN
ncbi:MAG: hypothetical protein C0617_02000 [Desulfuromonas sp.]|uniref:hypothetical protein n=1 Tax=Desulfuromonas sp. TaxID=892 RepID=UPI000CC91930|nr:hypothetical protein [Desulfuromonas sp.]PLX86155.1 MAG: hypothetical protein C0617_02000 [Desulfuromonas sp.]